MVVLHTNMKINYLAIFSGWLLAHQVYQDYSKNLENE